MPARWMPLALLLSLLLPIAASAEPWPSPGWGLLLSGGGGLFAGKNANTRGHLLSAHLLVATPVGLEFGLALQWGRNFRTTWALDSAMSEQAELREHPWGAFRGIAGEARYRFFRDRRVSPWVALRVGRSTSSKIRTDAFAPYRYTNSHRALAAGGGLEVRIHGPLGLTLAGYFQSCDINTRPHDNICTGAGPTVVLSPHLRF
ncbi:MULTISPECIES: hypothetical protein [Myxococcus]|uniref:hypothetical protein n=4 Tax=Myxococcaceae TaxID=31 RepID=UPI00114292B9|nr:MULTISPECIES: hypothetical protein [Myxococcus]